MRCGLVAILLVGIFGLTSGEVSTCARFFNPLVSSFTSITACYELEVDGETVGVVSNSDVVKTQGPNQGETCIRFTFVVRDGLGIRRAKVGLWNGGGFPRDKTRFTRKRKFLESEPTRVRIDACLDDIRSVADCCTGEGSFPFFVAEAKVRMEDGKVRTAILVDRSVAPVRQQVSDNPLAASEITCEGIPPGKSRCDRISDQNEIIFWLCTVQLSCSTVGDEPQFAGINRINRATKTVQFVVSPVAWELYPEELELTVYEATPVASRLSIPAQANTVVRRPAESIQHFESFSIATFAVQELNALSVVAFAVEFVVGGPIDVRFSVRAVPQTRELLEFIGFADAQVIADSGPLSLGQLATNSYFGPLPDAAVVGRIGSVICGYCLNPSLPPRGEWEVLTSGEPEGLNGGQFEAELARQPGRCIFDAQIRDVGSVCGPAGEEGILQVRDTVKGQVVCECTEPTPKLPE
ncbi:hypothetical protein NDN08_005322 [Rhodosorus marinus]|uniref:Uncharacterized protein n=1 Tax=Rhodosorus marinus TaxID=101924 RepID=A0AAV8V4D4_9RHOD|nr:hypothetical protein NDN08_005322 [Rhodosorus marinus]